MDEKVKVLCATCHHVTNHEVLHDVDSSGHTADYEYQWSLHHQIVRCLGCESVSYRTTEANSEDWYDGPSVSIYPPRAEGHQGLTETWALPTKVRQTYIETVHALANQQPILAGVGVRIIVEMVCEEKGATGKNLEKKIDDLVTRGVLTPDGANILHRTRLLGNKAAHEAAALSSDVLLAAMAVVEHVLLGTFILPKQAEVLSE